jgi:outer membrane receptor protein involved in Fe transport
LLTEYGNSARVGAAFSLGHGTVLRASYGRFYQHPRVATVAGPVLEFALQEGFDILPIPGERDQIWEIGYGIPLRGWTFDFDWFYNQTKNVVTPAHGTREPGGGVRCADTRVLHCVS